MLVSAKEMLKKGKSRSLRSRTVQHQQLRVDKSYFLQQKNKVSSYPWCI